MLDLIIIFGYISVIIAIIFVAVVHIATWKRAGEMRNEALRKEIQSYKVLDSEKPTKFAHTLSTIYDRPGVKSRT